MIIILMAIIQKIFLSGMLAVTYVTAPSYINSLFGEIAGYMDNSHFGKC